MFTTKRTEWFPMRTQFRLCCPQRTHQHICSNNVIGILTIFKAKFFDCFKKLIHIKPPHISRRNKTIQSSVLHIMYGFLLLENCVFRMVLRFSIVNRVLDHLNPKLFLLNPHRMTRAFPCTFRSEIESRPNCMTSFSKRKSRRIEYTQKSQIHLACALPKKSVNHRRRGGGERF